MFKRCRSFLTAVLVFLCVMSSGCAYFRSGEVAVEPWPPQSSSDRQAVNVWITGNLAGELLQEFSTNTLRAYRDSGLFSKVTQSSRKTEEGLTAEVAVAHTGDSNVLLAMFTGFTLYLFPSSASDSYLVKTTYRDTEGNVITETNGYLKQTLWQQLFLIFVMPFAGNDADEMFYDLSRHSLIRATEANAF